MKSLNWFSANYWQNKHLGIWFLAVIYFEIKHTVYAIYFASLIFRESGLQDISRVVKFAIEEY